MFQYHSTSQRDDPLNDHHGILRNNFGCNCSDPLAKKPKYIDIIIR